jgi:hypothetical protein
MKFITNLSSFKAGVLSKKLFGRVDIREHSEGLSIGENGFVAKEGGAYKRFGLRSVSQLSDDETAQVESVRLSSDRSVYLMFFSYPSYTANHSKWKLLDANGNQVHQSIDILGVVGGFSITKFDEWVVITHKDGHSPVFIRIGLSSVNKPTLQEIKLFDALSPYSYPQGKTNTSPTKKVRLNNVNSGTGATQIEATGFSLLDEFGVGDWVRVSGICYVNGAPRIGTGMYRITGNLLAATADVQSFFYYPTTLAGSVSFDALADLSVIVSGVYTIIQSGGANSQWFDEWSGSLWTGSNGYPKRAAVDEGRLVFSNAGKNKSTVWGSKTNDPFFFLDKRFLGRTATYTITGSSGDTAAQTANFDPPYSGDILETDPYQFTLSTKNSSQISVMESARHFLVGTDRQEFLINGNSGALSQKNFSARAHTSHGSYDDLSLAFDSTILLVGRGRRQLFLFKYSDQNGSFVSKELTILNGDPFENDSIRRMDWHEELSIVFVVTDAGNLITLTINEETQTAGFMLQPIDGIVLDCSYIIEEVGTEYMSLVVQRDGATYLDKITSAEPPVSSPLLELVDKLSYLDNARIISNSDTYSTNSEDSVTIFDSINDHVPYNYSTLKIGDTVEFNCSNASVLSGTGLALATPYYVIPFKDSFGNAGMRLALSLVDAQSNTYINITGSGIALSDDLIYPTFVRDVQTIPTEQFQLGETVTVFGVFGGAVEEFTFTADGNATYDLGKVYTEVAYGQTYEFHIATLPIEAGQQWGSAQLGIKRVDRAGVRVYKTRSFKISTDGYNSEEVDFDGLYTGIKQIPVTGSPDFEQVIHIQNSKAEGCYVASLALRGLSNDG